MQQTGTGCLAMPGTCRGRRWCDPAAAAVAQQELLVSIHHLSHIHSMPCDSTACSTAFIVLVLCSIPALLNPLSGPSCCRLPAAFGCLVAGAECRVGRLATAKVYAFSCLGHKARTSACSVSCCSRVPNKLLSPGAPARVDGVMSHAHWCCTGLHSSR